ncbi:MAG: efflux RND transporter permease subunit, partial [Pseudomonadota bacterium]
MQLTRLAIDNSRVMVLLVLFLTIYGIIVYLNYPSSEDPTIQIRTVKINAQAPALSPTQMENLVSRPLEEAVRNVDQVTDVTAAVRRGSTIITVTIGDYVSDVTEAIQAIRNRVENTTPTLPQAVTNVTVQEDIGLVAIASIALWADGFSYADMRRTAEDIEARIMDLEEVRKVTFYGVQDQQIFVDFDPIRVAELGVDPQIAANAIIAQNQPEPTGVAFVSGRRLVVVPTGALQNAEDVASVLFQDPESGDLISIGAIADVRTGFQDPPNQPVLYNGRPAIVLAVSTHEGTNNVDFGQELTSLVNEIQYELPIGMELGFATYQPDLIEESIDEAMENVYETVGIVLFVVLVFLGIRAGLIVGSLVPISMLAGVILMSLMGVEFQRMSITAVIIALGLLVDNGIVIAEDMRVRIERGATHREAAIQSGTTLALPLLNSALTTSVAFVPIVLIAGSTGDYVRSLGTVVIMLVLSSWFLAMTVTPLFCVWFLKVKKKDNVEEDLQIEDYRGWLYTPYSHFIRAILGPFRIPFVILIAGCLAASVWALNRLPTEFFPLGEREQYLIYITMETQADIRSTYAVTHQLADWLSDSEANPEVASNVAYIGSGGPRFFLSLTPLDPAQNVAFILVDVEDGSQVAEMIERTNTYVDANLPGVNVDAKQMWMGATEPGVIDVRLIGPTSQTLELYRVAEQLQDVFYSQNGAEGVSIDWGNPAIELRLVIDQARAERQGVSTEDVTNALFTTLNGQQITSLRESEFEIPVVVQSGEASSEGL